jgi:hypothetical protein
MQFHLGLTTVFLFKCFKKVQVLSFSCKNDVYYESARAIQPHSDTYPYTCHLGQIFHRLKYFSVKCTKC